MNIKGPKNDGKYEWTEHSKFKMQYYGLSPQRVLRVIRAPHRIETGIVDNTVAVMQPGGNVKKGNKGSFGQPAFFKTDEVLDGKSWSSEIWVMYQLRGSEASSKLKIPNSKKIHDLRFMIQDSANRKIRIISAWRYPGVTDENNPIPEEILREIDGII